MPRDLDAPVGDARGKCTAGANPGSTCTEGSGGQIWRESLAIAPRAFVGGGPPEPAGANGTLRRGWRRAKPSWHLAEADGDPTTPQAVLRQKQDTLWDLLPQRARYVTASGPHVLLVQGGTTLPNIATPPHRQGASHTSYHIILVRPFPASRGTPGPSPRIHEIQSGTANPPWGSLPYRLQGHESRVDPSRFIGSPHSGAVATKADIRFRLGHMGRPLSLPRGEIRRMPGPAKRTLALCGYRRLPPALPRISTCTAPGFLDTI